MYKLIIFAVFMLLMSAICNGQGVTLYGASRAQDTSKTKGQQVWSAYAGSADTTILILLPNGTVKQVAKGAFSGAATLQQVLAAGDSSHGNVMKIALDSPSSGHIRLYGGVNTDVWLTNNTGKEFSLGVGGNGTGLEDRFYIYDVTNNLAPFVVDDDGHVHMGGFADVTPGLSVESNLGFSPVITANGKVRFRNTPVRSNFNDSTLGLRSGDTVTVMPPLQPVLDGKQDVLGFTPEEVLNLIDFGAIPDDTLDDTWAIQVAIDSAHALGGRVKIYCPAGMYLVGDTLQKLKGGRDCNAQLVIPHNDRVQDTSEGFIYITIEGAALPAEIDGYLVSSLGAPDPLELAKYSATFRSTIDNDGSTYPAILGVAEGGLIPSAGVHVNHISVYLKNLTFISKYDSANGGAQLCGVDFNNSIGQYSENIRISLDTPGSLATVRDYELFAFRGINAWGNTNILKNSVFSGYKYAAVMGAHGIVEKFMPFNCDYGLVLQQNEQGLVLADYMPVACRWNIAAGIIDSGICRLTGYYHSEKVNTGVGASLGDLYDPSNLVHGKIQFSIFRNQGSWEHTFVRTGGRNLVVEACDSSRVYMYGNGTYGGIYTDSLNHVFTHGGLTVSHVSSSTVTRPHTIGLLAGYTGSGRTDGLLVTNSAEGTGQSINAGTLNAGIAGGANASTIGYNVGVRGAAVNSSTWNHGVQGSATGPVGNNIGGFFFAGNISSGATEAGVMAVLGTTGTPTTMPTIVESAALIADPLSTGKTAMSIQVNGVRKFRVDSVGNVMIGVGAPSGNPLDIFASSNSSIGIRVQNTSSGTAARAGLDLVNNQSDVFRISLTSSGFTTAGVIAARDASISYGGGGKTVINNTSNTVVLSTVSTARLTVKNNGIINLSNTPTYADNAAALAGGLVAGDIYRTSTGQLMIVF